MARGNSRGNIIIVRFLIVVHNLIHYPINACSYTPQSRNNSFNTVWTFLFFTTSRDNSSTHHHCPTIYLIWSPRSQTQALNKEAQEVVVVLVRKWCWSAHGTCGSSELWSDTAVVSAAGALFLGRKLIRWKLRFFANGWADRWAGWGCTQHRANTQPRKAPIFSARSTCTIYTRNNKYIKWEELRKNANNVYSVRFSKFIEIQEEEW